MAFNYEHVTVTKVTDGDTFKIQIDLGFSTLRNETLRVYDLDTHEARRIKRNGKRVSEAEVTSGKECKELVTELLLGKEIRIQTHKEGKGKYGRYLISIEFEKDGEYIDYAEYIKSLGYDRNLNPL